MFYIFQGRGAEDESWKAVSRITSVETENLIPRDFDRGVYTDLV